MSSSQKKHSSSTSALAGEIGSSQVTQQQLLPTNSQPQSQSPLQSPQEKRQSQPWSAHFPPSGQSPSPFLRNAHALSMNATAAGELLLFGGYVPRYRSPSNGLYVFSTQDFSTTLLQTSGDAPSPRYGHRVVLTGTILLSWGGAMDSVDQNAQTQSSDDSFYLLNLVSREWSRIVVNGSRLRSRFYHSMTLVGSKLFVFGGKSPASKEYFNDIWVLDLDHLKSNPRWESYEPAPGNKKPLPRNAHVSVATGGGIIIFGGCDSRNVFNDTWSFNTSTRKWTELQCTGSIPSPRSSHAAILVGDVMYVFGGHAVDGTYLGDLTALNLSTQRWTAFQDIGPSPSGRSRHAMACDGTRVFVLGGLLSPNAQTDETKLIHVLDTKLLSFPEPDSVFNPNEETAQLVQKSSAIPPTRGQPHQGPDAPSVKDATRLEDGDGHLIEFERDRHVAQLTDQLEQKSALLEQAEANAADAKEHAELELHELQAKLKELTLSRDEHLRTLEQAQSALQKATSPMADADDSAHRHRQPACEHGAELAEMHAELEGKKSELEAVRLRLTDAENGWAKSKAEADTLRAQTAAGLFNVDVDRAMHRLMERMRAIEAEVSFLRGNEKSIEEMECRNEG